MNTAVEENTHTLSIAPSGRPMRPARIAGLFVAASLLGIPLPAAAQGAIGDILGAAIIEFRGAIAWSDGPDPARPRVDALQIAAAATEDADRIVVYAAEQDTTPEDFLTCEGSICTAHRVTGTGATTSVMRLSRGLDYGSGRVQYDLDAAFTIVSFASGTMVAETVTGRGAFICDAELPAALAFAE